MHELIKKLESNETGLITVLNFVDSTNYNILCKKIAKDFIVEWANESSGKNLDETMNIMWRIAQKNPEKYFQAGREYKDSTDILYTVMTYGDLKNRLSEDTKRNIKYAEIFELAEDFCLDFDNKKYGLMEENEAYILEAQSKLASSDSYFEIKFKNDQYLKSDLAGLVWFSKDIAGNILEDAVCHKSAEENPADVARDNLGLSHLGVDLTSSDQKRCPLLVAVRINIKELKNIAYKLSRPMVIDAGGHSRFRGVYGNFKKKANNYGRSTQLKTLSDQTNKLGSMEVLTPNFHPINAELMFLGYPRIPRKDFYGTNDDIYLQNILRGRKIDEITKSFCLI